MIPSTKVYLGIYTKEEAVVVNYSSTKYYRSNLSYGQIPTDRLGICL